MAIDLLIWDLFHSRYYKNSKIWIPTQLTLIRAQVLPIDGAQMGSNGLALTPISDTSNTNPSKSIDESKKVTLVQNSTNGVVKGAPPSGVVATLSNGLTKLLHSCAVCGKTFTEKHHMTRHERTVHECKKEYHCEVRSWNSSFRSICSRHLERRRM